MMFHSRFSEVQANLFPLMHQIKGNTEFYHCFAEYFVITGKDYFEIKSIKMRVISLFRQSLYIPINVSYFCVIIGKNKYGDFFARLQLR